MQKFTKIIVGGAVASVAFLSPLAAAVSTTPATQPAPLELVNVVVLDATTVEAVFNNPLDRGVMEAIPSAVFNVPHFNHRFPHAHVVTAVKVSPDGLTARVTLARALHSDNPPCDTEEPRCSKDPLPFIISEAKDIFGQTVTDDEFEVLSTGAKD
ncbi:hypothetical protein [Arthrobacter cavernae]|uniref:Uncharacterized protein n=1 Tax=Arthrobacter cavernae TaxID=2817681 RepID=A0A939HGW8_9MICC|nr:hypothetical protein [Arthrobacter cavernae]MBO1269706.1 hypothetical protein [Arthrobacter cavernae]